MNHLLLVLLQAQGGSPYQSLIMIGLILVVFYFFMIRPQIKKTKDQKKFREALKKGDKIITIGGIHGRIAEISDTTFIIEVENNVRLKIEKAAVSMDNTNLLGKDK
jgi:preprotein translocase subunit YajC